MRVVSYGKGRVPIGKGKKLTFNFRTRKFGYPEYSWTGFLTDGMVPGKSYRMMIRLWGEKVQICGAKDEAKDTSLPMIAEAGTPFIIRSRTFYRYKWIPGNVSPSIYGSQFYPGSGGADTGAETVQGDALGWDAIPLLHATRAAAYSSTAEVTTDFPGFGRMAYERRNEANINPVLDCTGDTVTPNVNTGP